MIRSVQEAAITLATTNNNLMRLLELVETFDTEVNSDVRITIKIENLHVYEQP